MVKELQIRTLDDVRSALAADVVEGAKALLGCHLIHGERKAVLVEVEAYRGADDPASHAFRGPTARNAVMFGPPGFAYVYFSYGVHWMLNVIALPAGPAGGVLIRAAKPLEGLEEMREIRKTHSDKGLLSGPGKLCQAFGIDARFNGIDLLDPDSELRLEPGDPPKRIGADVRIGIAKGKGHETPWRFVDLDEAPWLSKRVQSG